MPIRNSPKGKAEVGVKGSAEEGLEVAHARNDLGEDVGDEPEDDNESQPGGPADDGVAGLVVGGLAEDETVDELDRDVCVDGADDGGGDDDGAEGDLLIVVLEGAEGGGLGVLAEVVKSDDGGDDEEGEGGEGEDGEGLGEVARLAHLGDEAGKEDLGEPEEGGVEYSVDAVDPGRAGLGEGVGFDGASDGVGALHAGGGVVFDADEDHEEQDGQAHADGAADGHDTDVAQGAWDGDHDADECDDDAEHGGAQRVVGDRVEHLRAHQDVEAAEDDVVPEQHEHCRHVRQSVAAKEQVADIANVADLRVFHDELP